MIYGSVCSGIEAATVAWHPLGWKPAFFSDIEDFPRELLAHHYPDVPCHGDFTTISGDDYGSIDLLVGGTPCQAFSVAGLRKGFDDDRGNLTLEFIRLAQRKKPRWILWENVPGVLSIDGGRAFAAFLGGLAELGYGFAYRVLDAQYFGVPQRRRRVFVVGHLGDWRAAAAVLFERESLCRDITPSREQREGTATCFEPRSQDGVPRLSGDLSPTLNTAQGGQRQPCVMTFDRQSTGEYGTDPVASTVAARDYKGPTDLITYSLAGNTIGRKPENGGNGDGWNADVAYTLTKTDQHAVAFVSPVGTDLYNGNITGDVAATLGTPGSSSCATGPTLLDKMAVRRLTPKECERLQGFPDNYTLIPFKGKPAADSHRYKALGNSMAVPVMRWIGERINFVNNLKNTY
jgi:DNA (cytosine-5)-methyltransferase 1